MVKVLKFQAVGSLVTIHLNLQKMMKSPESRCRRQHKGKNEKKPISQYEQDTFQKVFHARERDVSYNHRLDAKANFKLKRF